VTDPARQRLVLERTAAPDPVVATWLSALEEARGRTLRALDGLREEQVDWAPEGEANTIGALLYHIAAIEADWLFADILGPESGRAWPAELFPHDVRDAEGTLTAIRGLPLDEHRARLAKTRAILLENLSDFTAEDFQRVRPREDYDVSAAWVLHHLLQHEAEHRAQIAALREAATGFLEGGPGR
jgi:uncharacterized damage-inducible protein DinB